MPLNDSKIDKLTNLIADSFRVHPNQDPIYVDVGNHLQSLSSKQHQIVFGRRGSGKSCLLVHYHQAIAKRENVLSIYINADELKTLRYPDLLIRLILMIGEGLERATSSWVTRLFRRDSKPLAHELQELRSLLDQADVSKVSDQTGARSTSTASAGVTGGTVGGAANLGAGLSASMSDEVSAQRTSEFMEQKVDTLERHLPDYKTTLTDALERSKFTHVAVIIDDFYLISPIWQPNVIDYVHRLLRGTHLYLKVGTIRHRTIHVRYANGQTIGVELAQDVEEINLDQTLQDIEATRGYLARMLDSMGERVGLRGCSREYLSEDGLLALTLASGGVPRDFLTIFVEAVASARSLGNSKWLTPTPVYKGANRVSYNTKLNNLRNDAGQDAVRLESLYVDLVRYCLTEKKKTAFLIGQNDALSNPAEHEKIKQLMDFKLIHVIEPDTSAASGRTGRYEAYTLGFALFMEPRRRGIEIVEFWRVDEQRRRVGLRESPVYELSRSQSGASTQAPGSTTEKALQDIQADSETDEATEESSQGALWEG